MLDTATANYKRFFLIKPTPSKSIGWETNLVSIFGDALTATNIFFPSVTSVYLGALQNKKYDLKKYIEVKIKIDWMDVIGEIPELGIYAFGNNAQEVVEEIEKDIIELYEELSELNNNKLGTLPKKWKKFLTEHIEKG